jgi:hypothetical protein
MVGIWARHAQRQENSGAASAQLSPEDLQELAITASKISVQGARYQNLSGNPTRIAVADESQYCYISW